MSRRPGTARPAPVDGRAAADWLAAFGADVALAAGVRFEPATLKAAFDGALALGRAARRLPEAMRVLAEGEARLAALARRLRLDRRAATVDGRPFPRVALVEGIADAGLTLGGRWVADVAAAAGAHSVGPRAGGRSEVWSIDDLDATDPDVLIFALPDRSVADAAGLMRGRLDRPPWRDLRAVRDGRAYALDGTRFVNRPGPGLVRTVEMVAAAVHGPAAEVDAAPDELLPL